MDPLIGLSEVARNLALPAIGSFGVLIACWQALMARRKNGLDILAKSAELFAGADAGGKRAAFALLLDAAENRSTREMALPLLLHYISEEDDMDVLQSWRDLAEDRDLARYVTWQIDGLKEVEANAQ
ncbi:hypothetical protein LQ948_15915 [Jiella sp. MQZ9-1]|uniref:Uncharacterized protein n=1 Tax=Jiella flava TaxID=2816857 RepID=A0A939G1H4_9HYPH|nr:hypothetical protein [Jiella flava]MBO0664120.1 hypothetical protein [Jiella flava]MCD2472692.1 hypothetical protein [Jiella flava]